MDKVGGPPYGLSQGAYRELLDSEWECVWRREVGKDEGRDAGADGKGEVTGGVSGAGEAIAMWRRRAE